MQQKHSTLNDFEVISKLGEGAFGVVWRVKRKQDGKEYALKKVKLTTMKEKQRENSVNETRILASLNAPNIIAYKEAFYDEPTASLNVVMEYASGGDLQKLINEHKKNRTKFPQDQIWKALVHMTKGLKALHNTKILHRDLKCANVFLQQGTYKLGDLNVSKVLKQGLAHTQTGTPYYASPQVWMDQPYDLKSDIWSLGCVIYEMAALRPPFTGNDLQGLFRKVKSGVYERIPSVYSNDLHVVIGMLLKVSPGLRPNAEGVLGNEIVRRRFRVEEGFEEGRNPVLLNTIKFNPKNLVALKGKLPKANYVKEVSEEEEERRKNQEIKRQKTQETKRSEKESRIEQLKKEMERNDLKQEYQKRIRDRVQSAKQEYYQALRIVTHKQDQPTKVDSSNKKILQSNNSKLAKPSPSPTPASNKLPPKQPVNYHQGHYERPSNLSYDEIKPIKQKSQSQVEAKEKSPQQQQNPYQLRPNSQAGNGYYGKRNYRENLQPQSSQRPNTGQKVNVMPAWWG